MKKKKLILINPVTQKKRGFSLSLTSRNHHLALGIIAALTPDNWDAYDCNEVVF